jgi:APA family basic amino acid/polyamine antiporter
VSTDVVGPVSDAAEDPVRDEPVQQKVSGFGLPTATALVVGSVIGTGVFGLPAALAVFGPISLVAFSLVTIGGLALALTFGALSKRIRGSGGPYVYARDAFGDFAGFLNAWCYWITAWAGNAAIVVALVGYAEVFVNKEHTVLWSIVIALAGLWIPAVINLSGLRSMAVTQIVSTVLKFVPLLFMATVGLVFVKSENFGPFNGSGISFGGAISAAAAIALFSYIGIETASVAAGRVRDPQRNVGRATVFGTIGCAVVYVLGTLTVFGTVPNGVLRDSTAPFTDSANAIFGGQWAGQAVAIAAVVSGLGCLIGWTLIIGEMPMAAAKDRLFPAVFLRTRRDVPSFGIISSTVLASVLVIVSYTNFEQVFTTLVLLSVFTAVVPYLFSAAAQLYWLLTRGRQTAWPHLLRDVGVSALALVFSFWALAGSGYQAVYYGVICLLLGVPLYVWLKVGHKEYGEAGS